MEGVQGGAQGFQAGRFRGQVGGGALGLDLAGWAVVIPFRPGTLAEVILAEVILASKPWGGAPGARSVAAWGGLGRSPFLVPFQLGALAGLGGQGVAVQGILADTRPSTTAAEWRRPPVRTGRR
jgi:hypothetical protein